MVCLLDFLGVAMILPTMGESGAWVLGIGFLLAGAWEVGGMEVAYDRHSNSSKTVRCGIIELTD